MALTPGTHLGPYEVRSALGAGGMGEVYRALDTRLDREVAIKVLPDAVAQDPERLTRFEREAKALAALNHPNVAQIYAVEAGAIVMELVPGETLRGPLPLATALDYATQIAAALEAAHEKGLVHRDLKPGNVMVTPDGVVKVLDFSLAGRPASSAGPDPDLSPTLTLQATQAGVIVGTAAYMAPEQASGKPVDKRADIWAFGVVLWEMLTGRRLFEGETISHVLAAVLTKEPDLTAVPARVRPLIARCLEKDPRKRLRDIGDAMSLVLAADAAVPAPAASNRVRERIAWACAAVLAVLLLAAAAVALRGATEGEASPGAVRLPFVPPAPIVSDDEGYSAVIVSPDGQKLVFTGRVEGGRRQLWLRRLDAVDAEPLPDTDDASEPFWSPDSRSVGFGSRGKLRRVDLAGGRAQVLADAARLNNGASWGTSGVIVFSPDYNKGLYQVAADGASASRELKPGATSPSFLPGGRRFLFSRAGQVLVGSLDSPEDTPVPGVSGPVKFVPDRRGSSSGWLLFVRNEVLTAQPFDASALRLAGEAATVGSGSSSKLAGNRIEVSASDTGVLAIKYLPGVESQLTWLDRSGTRRGTLGPPVKTVAPLLPSLSPDERQVTLQRPELRRQGIWIVDAARGTADPVAVEASGHQMPVWSRDGRSVFFSATVKGAPGIYRAAVPAGNAEVVLQGTVFPRAVSPDGRWLLYMQRGETTRLDVWALPLMGHPKPVPVLVSAADEGMARLSPDGRWLAYTSDVSGTLEVYVRRFMPDATVGEPIRVSTGAGSRPRWRGDGRELFYTAAPQDDGAVVEMRAVPVTPRDATMDIGQATTLFTTRMRVHGAVFTDYDVTSDGQRFLFGALPGPADMSPIATVVLNWTAAVAPPAP
jgi:Tol biopolymer transport system component